MLKGSTKLKKRRTRGGERPRKLLRDEKVQQLRAEQACEGANTDLSESWEDAFHAALREAQLADPHFRQVHADIDAHVECDVDAKGLLWKTDDSWEAQLRLPSGTFDGRSFREHFLKYFRTVLGLAAHRILHHAVRQQVYWDRMGFDVEKYCRTCLSCQADKCKKTRPRGKLRSPEPPNNGYEQLNIDFTGRHPTSFNANGVEHHYTFTLIQRAMGKVELLAYDQTRPTFAK